MRSFLPAWTALVHLGFQHFLQHLLQECFDRIILRQHLHQALFRRIDHGIAPLRAIHGFPFLCGFWFRHLTTYHESPFC
ncbi:MAG: hypothetical protein PHQ04_00810 [Opitutaceae bacterium]|nr:hypothetical protein [Opitutaceae bacterium]